MAIRTEMMKIETLKLQDGGTQGLVDERLHSWMVQGDGRGVREGGRG